MLQFSSYPVTYKLNFPNFNYYEMRLLSICKIKFLRPRRGKGSLHRINSFYITLFKYFLKTHCVLRSHTR